MKKLLIVFATLCFSLTGFSQSKNMKLINKLKEQSLVSLDFKTLAIPILSADDDCKPPPCSGLIDPWTCECTPDLKDPWGDEKIASKLNGVKKLESAIARGEGKGLLPNATLKAAKAKFPGNSLKAIYSRAQLYTQALSRNMK